MGSVNNDSLHFKICRLNKPLLTVFSITFTIKLAKS